MAVQTKEVLKSYFETGDKPTQEEFADLIDTLQTEDEVEEAIDEHLAGNSVGTAILEFNPSGLTDEQKAHNAEIYQKINDGVAIQVYFSGGFALTPLNVRSHISGAGIGTVYVLSADTINTTEPSSLTYMSFKLSSDGDIQIYEQKEYPLGINYDDELSDTSENAVPNKIIKAYVDASAEMSMPLSIDFNNDFNNDFAI